MDVSFRGPGKGGSYRIDPDTGTVERVSGFVLIKPAPDPATESAAVDGPAAQAEAAEPLFAEDEAGPEEADDDGILDREGGDY